mmetsp:Transcript_102641/g.173971  ORF Transcript_102641/g.173971 Transcript_102641/m.173971 type:complete len:371 (-) Transcript_102641:15-1127(-)
MQAPVQQPLEYKYNRIKVIGKGSFGEAVLVRNKEDRRRYVAKEINLATMSHKEKEDAKNEIRVLAQLSHPNIVKLYEYLMYRSKLYIVMEYADGGDLDGKIKKAKQVNSPFQEDQIMNWFVQLCLSLKHLHDKRILHRDLKAGNVFLMNNGIVKLGDFGISTVLRNTLAQAMTVCGTPYYFSPEICKNKPYNNKSDIWALGCVLYEMITLNHAFNGRNIYELMKAICVGRYNPISNAYSRELSQLLNKMLAIDPRLRLSIDNLLRVNFVQEELRKLTSVERQPQRDALAHQPRRTPESRSPDGGHLPPVNPQSDWIRRKQEELQRDREREQERQRERERDREAREKERQRERDRLRELEHERQRERELER